MTTSSGPPRDDAAWFRSCYEQTYDDLLRFVQRRAHPSHAEDVVADVFLVAWCRLPDLPRDLDCARAWLFGIAYKTLANARRGQDRREALALRVADHLQPTDAGADPDLVAARLDLASAWRSLSAAHQEALALRAWDGLTSPQAAAVLGISPTAYRLRLSRARRALRTHLHHDHPAADGRAVPEASQS